MVSRIKLEAYYQLLVFNM